MGAAQSAKVEASILSKVQKLKTNREGWQSVIEEFLTLVPATGAPLRCRDRRVLEVVLQLCAEELRDPQPTVTPLLEATRRLLGARGLYALLPKFSIACLVDAAQPPHAVDASS